MTDREDSLLLSTSDADDGIESQSDEFNRPAPIFSATGFKNYQTFKPDQLHDDERSGSFAASASSVVNNN